MASAIPGAVAALIAVMESALPAGTEVYFGKELSRFNAPQMLHIFGVTGDQMAAELGPSYRREETFAVHCKLTSYAGDQDHQTRMTEVFDLFHTIETTIGNDPTLNGTVRFAEVGTFDYEPNANIDGKSLGQLVFAVHCSARVTSLT